MDEKDRDKLIVNCAKLVPKINWPAIFPKLIDHGIYHKENKNVQRWEKHLDDKSTHREMYLKISTRGPQAFENFILCLEEMKYDELVHILKKKEGDQVSGNEEQVSYNVNERIVVSQVNILTVNAIDDPVADESLLHKSDRYYTHLQHTEKPLKIYLKKATEFMCPSFDQVMCYSMSSNPRGLVLIINNILFAGQNSERSAAEHDENNLKDLFEQMGFSVEIFKNLKRAEMLETVSAFSKRQKLRHVHSAFVIIMSHGDEHVQDNRSESVVYGVDDKAVAAQEILNFFTAENCVDMCKKPKIFIFQTCRGRKTQRVVISKTVGASRHDTDISKCVEANATQIPVGCRDLSDVLVAHSTLPGHVAHRDRFTGSWYIQTLCEVIMNHAYKEELLRLLQMTDERLSSLHNDYKECQTSVFMNYGFNKKCYLNPGLFQN